jgi:copper chaperone CopZ
MKTLYTLLVATFLFATTLATAQIKNSKKETVSINGNCGMCKKTIEKAGNEKGVSTLVWNEETKEASLVFDSKKTTKEEILKKVANAGYENESFAANGKAYDALHGCCQYDRKK